MKVALQQNPLTVDATCEPVDVVEVEMQSRPGGQHVLYISVNGATVFRVNRIQELVLTDGRLLDAEAGR